MPRSVHTYVPGNQDFGLDMQDQRTGLESPWGSSESASECLWGCLGMPSEWRCWLLDPVIGASAIALWARGIRFRHEV